MPLLAAVNVMKTYISPFTVVLTYNLEPIYGIRVWLLFLFPEKEKMSAHHFIMGLIIDYSHCDFEWYSKIKNIKKR